MGFLKLHLEHPHMDNITLFKGTRAFVMKMEDGESILGKVEKGFELTTNSINLASISRVILCKTTLQMTSPRRS
jgi:hypothetical protein